jgi:hypothetical protein
MTDFCSLSMFFCSLSVSISLLGYVPSFLGDFSHDTKVVAPSLSFLSVLKSCYLLLFSLRKTQNKKKNWTLLKIFYLISPHREHFRTKFQLILEAVVQGYNFRFCPFLVIGHVTMVQISHWMDPDRYNHLYLVFLHFLVQPDEISFLRHMQMTLTWTLKVLPSYVVCTISNFSAII